MKPAFKFPIVAKVLTTFLLAAVAPLILILLLFFRLLDNAEETRRSDLLGLGRQVFLTSLETEQHRLETQIRIFAQDPRFLDWRSQDQDQDQGPEEAGMADLFIDYGLGYAGLAGGDGRILASARLRPFRHQEPPKDRLWLDAARNRPRTLREPAPGGLRTYVALRLEPHSGSSAGAEYLILGHWQPWDLFSHYARTFAQDFTLYRQDSVSGPLRPVLGTQYDAYGLPAAQELLQVPEAFWGRGRESLSPWDRLFALPGDFFPRLALRVELKAHDNPSLPFRWITVSFIGVLLLVISLTALLLSSHLSRPLRTLLEAFQTLRRDLSGSQTFHPLELSGQDEIAELTRAYNSLGQELTETHAELRQALEALEGRNRELKDLDKLKDEFLANTSHELRTPLNGIIGLAEALHDGLGGSVNPAQKKNLSLIISSARRLANLVNDILDLARLQHGQLEIWPQAVNLKVCGDLVFRLMEPLARGKDLRLENSLETQPQALADEGRLQQVLINLIENAIKFTEAGVISLTQRRLGDRLEISVSDQGIGIAPDKQQAIFNAFEQADGSISRAYGGTGLGLAVCRRLIELQGGQIGVDSLPGRGSRFWFTLPIADPAQHPAAPGAEGLPEAYLGRYTAPDDGEASEPVSPTELMPLTKLLTPQRYTILVVDDEMVNRHVLTNILTMAGFNCVPLERGPDVLDWVQAKGPPDLIVLDVMMPKMSGYEVCDLLRQHYPLIELPILFLTAKTEARDILEGFRRGANDFIQKPVAKDEFLARVRTHLALTKWGQTLKSFAPEGLLSLLGKPSLLDLSLGDHTELQASLLVADLRRFSSLAQPLGSAEVFQFLNDYLGRLSPAVRRHEGHIDKYRGDGFLALFPGDPRSGLEAAFEGQAALEAWFEELNPNSRTSPKAGAEIRPRFGLALHRGLVRLGLVGQADRRDATFVSDEVSLTFRLQSLARELGLGLVATGTYLDSLDPQERPAGRRVAWIELPSTRGRLSVHELWPPAKEALARRRLSYDGRFQAALAALQTGLKDPGAWAALQREAPDDQVLAFYAARVLADSPSWV